MNKFFTLILLFLMTNAEAAVKLGFEVSFIEPQAHYAEVKMNISGIAKDYVDLKMPVWTPGSYLVREFSKNVEGFSAATASGKQLPVERVRKNTWRVYANKGDFTVSYRVYAFEISVRTAFVDASHAFLSPAGVFLYPDGMLAQPCTVEIQPYNGWKKISTGLEPVSGQENTFYAPDFDILFDSPIEVGNQDVFSFSAAGVNYEMAMYGQANYDKQRLMKDMPKVIETQTAIFGENPNKRYVFIVHNYAVGSGGLEHLNSTVLGVARNSYGTESGYVGFLRLAAHEHFHLWNVKRLRPKALGPFDYENENYTTNLWIAEGFTSFFDKFSIFRAGFSTPEAYMAGVLGDVGIVENQPGNRIQSASEASYDAWTKQYRPNENSKNTTISYYNKGALIATVMNLEIMHATKGEKSLDDLMRAMYETYYKKLKRGYTDAEFREMAGKIAGKSLDEIYNDYVNGTEPINYNKYFGYAGLKMIYDDAAKTTAVLGLTLALKDGKTTVTNVARGSAGWDDGINVNDEILAINDQRINPVAVETGKATEVDKAIASMKPGDKITVLVNRDGLLQTLKVTLKGDPTIKFKVLAEESVTPAQAAVRKKWLNI
ncbi:M61 family metallopeptidase [Hufsiella ginkgonis]|uniref:PDZ domain-containing protein n=1 Tax=Hufsiella ginkgonis TaxID=2695274 RepID=A0A7K1XTU8_9SPHI|nr:PDZ domain-containing protein [Hufsiella ginkgonis]MXV13936.1 PDZ domain-containing protein [Hufsiella ginkgonis]